MLPNARRGGFGINAGVCFADFVRNVVSFVGQMRFNLGPEIFEGSSFAPKHVHASDSRAPRIRPIAAAMRFHSLVFAVSRFRPLAVSL